MKTWGNTEILKISDRIMVGYKLKNGQLGKLLDGMNMNNYSQPQKPYTFAIPTSQR